jgi:hypothetical protein
MKIGDKIKIGEYDWRVLDIQEDKILVITDKIVGFRPLHDRDLSVPWVESTLKNYLNDEFLKTLEEDISFKDQDFEILYNTTVNTKIFLLSKDEAMKYFKNNRDRIAYDNKGKRVYWWLRSPGYTSYHAAIVSYIGTVVVGGTFVDNTSVGVRPAMWVKI